MSGFTILVICVTVFMIIDRVIYGVVKVKTAKYEAKVDKEEEYE